MKGITFRTSKPYPRSLARRSGWLVAALLVLLPASGPAKVDYVAFGDSITEGTEFDTVATGTACEVPSANITVASAPRT